MEIPQVSDILKKVGSRFRGLFVDELIEIAKEEAEDVKAMDEALTYKEDPQASELQELIELRNANNDEINKLVEKIRAENSNADVDLAIQSDDKFKELMGIDYKIRKNMINVSKQILENQRALERFKERGIEIDKNTYGNIRGQKETGSNDSDTVGEDNQPSDTTVEPSSNVEYVYRSNESSDSELVASIEERRNLLKAVKSILDKVTSIDNKTSDTAKISDPSPEAGNTVTSPGNSSPETKEKPSVTPPASDTKGTTSADAAKEAADQEVKKYWAGKFQDVLVNDKPSKAVMDTVWKQLASEAINKMFGINNHAILDSLGKGKGKKDTDKEASKDKAVAKDTSPPAANNATQSVKTNTTVAKGTALTDSVTDTEGEFKEINKLFASNFQDIIAKGTSFKDAMKNIWNRIASDAIAQMFHVENQAKTFGELKKLGKSQGKNQGKGKSQGKGKGKGVTPAHSGEIIGVNAPRMHSGGVIPYLKNDEVLRTLQTGEEVISRKDRTTNMQLMGLMGELFQSQQQAQQQSPPVVIHISAWDTQDVYERLRKNGDALVAVLREQNALGNRF